MAYYKYTNTIDVPGTVTTEDDFLAWLQAEVGDTVYNEAETAVTEEREEATCVYYNRAIADGKVTATKVSTDQTKMTEMKAAVDTAIGKFSGLTTATSSIAEITEDEFNALP